MYLHVREVPNYILKSGLLYYKLQRVKFTSMVVQFDELRQARSRVTPTPINVQSVCTHSDNFRHSPLLSVLAMLSLWQPLI